MRAYHETYHLPITISNCANNYGSHQFPEKVLPLFTTRALDGQPLPVYKSKHNRREWIHALDHVRAIEAILDRGIVGETYHVGTGVEASVEQMADLVLDELGLPDSLKQEVEDRPGHDRRYLLDSTKIRRELGWQPDHRVRRGHARNHPLVRRQPHLVGTAARPQPRRRRLVVRQLIFPRSGDGLQSPQPMIFRLCPLIHCRCRRRANSRPLATVSVAGSEESWFSTATKPPTTRAWSRPEPRCGQADYPKLLHEARSTSTIIRDLLAGLASS